MKKNSSKICVPSKMNMYPQMETPGGTCTPKQKYEWACWIKAVWCLAHRLELAVKDAFKSTYMDRVIEMLISIYYFYKGSAKRFKEAEDIAELLGEHFLKPEKANGTRWVDHKLRATAKLIENWPIIVI